MMALPVEQVEEPKMIGARDKTVHYDEMISPEAPFISLDPGD